MVYGRRFYKNRRTYRRNSRTLSTRNIFNNKSSRAQASQLYRLNRKVNNIYRACKPELKIIETQPQSFNMTSYSVNYDDPANLIPIFSSPQNPSRVMSISMPDNGDGDNELIGNVCNLRDMTVFLNVNYELIKDTRLNTISNLAFPDSTFVRFVFFMSKMPNDDVLEPNELFDLKYPNSLQDVGITSLGSYPTGYKMNTVLPLLEGTSSRFSILKDIRIKVGSNNTDKQLKVRIPLSRYSKFIKNQYTIFDIFQI